MAAPRIKFCGITRLEDAQVAVDNGAWALGVIMWPGSERVCSQDEAARIAATFRRQVKVCGVFVNQHLDEVSETIDALGLTMAQLHGDEGPAFCSEVARRTGAQVIKAARIRDKADLQALEPFHTDFHLVDSHKPGMFGGTGETFDWALAASRHSQVRLILSGGLTAENVAAGIAATNPYAVDTASGTEAAPGIKDHAKLRAFAEAVRATAEVPAAS